MLSHRYVARLTALAVALSALAVVAFTAGPSAGAADRAPAPEPAVETALSGVAHVTTGEHHSCALMTSGQVRCWGLNSYGQLGDGTQVSRTRPVTVKNPAGTGALSGVAQVIAGANHTCARLTNGKAVCWGFNGRGQLGDASTVGRFRPVKVVGPSGTGALRNITLLTADGSHTCALLASTEAMCWGDDTYGALGDGLGSTGEQVLSAVPVSVVATTGPGFLTGITHLVTGGGHSCAVLANGQARCWGSSAFGELGDGSTGIDGRPRPVVVLNGTGTGPLTGVSLVSAGVAHSCAVMTNARARCWGSDTADYVHYGQLGTRSDSIYPATVLNSGGSAPLTGVSMIRAGDGHTCARLSAGLAACWGANYDGRLGIGRSGIDADRDVPVLVQNTAGTAALTGVSEVAAGAAHNCARLSSGLAACWGANSYGQLGDGTQTQRTRPVLVTQ